MNDIPNPLCPRCNSDHTELRVRTDDFRCRDCKKVFSPNQNPYRKDTISWHVCEELFIGGNLADIAVRVMARLPDNITTTSLVYFRTSQVTKELRERHYRVEKSGDYWKAYRGISAVELDQARFERGRWKSRVKKIEELGCVK